MGVQARNQLQICSASGDELFAPTITDFLQRLDAVGDESRAHHQELLHTLGCKGLQLLLSVRLDPLGPAQARLKRDRPLVWLQPGTLGEPRAALHALRTVA